MDSIAGYNFFVVRDDALADEYDGKRWACNFCRVPDLELVRDRVDGPQRIVIRCSVNRFAPFANSCNCPSYDPDPQLLELLS